MGTHPIFESDFDCLTAISRGKMVLINALKARQIFDSRGNPTVEVDLTTNLGVFRAAVPSGASTGIYEALELRDKVKSDYHGKGVSKAIANVNNIIAKELVGKDWDLANQSSMDDLLINLDGTANKEKLGANAILGVSLAIAKVAGNNSDKMVMPVPSFNVINGGSHAGNKLAMQEFMLFPFGAANFTEAMKMGSETYHHLKTIIKKKFGQDATNVGDEGGFAPNILVNTDALDLIVDAIEVAGYKGKIGICVDPAASEFWNNDLKKYDLDFKNDVAGDVNDTNRYVTPKELAQVYMDMIKKYPIMSIEDPFDQDDFEGYCFLTKTVGEGTQIMGDDLLVTNPSRIQNGIDKNACNCLLLKVNQIGTLTESIKACKMSHEAGWNVMVSHRSGETEDSFIADLVVGLQTGQIKTGAPCRSERMAKYNQLLRIEEQLGDKAIYAGNNWRSPAKAL